MLSQQSVSNLERRAILRSGATVIVDARGRYVGVTEPLLHLCNVGLVVERIGGGGRAQRMRTDHELELRRVGSHQFVDAVRRDRLDALAGAVVTDRPKQRAVLIRAVAGGLKVVMNEGLGAGMQRQIPRLAAFAGHLEVRHAFTGVLRVFHLELA